MNYEEKWETLKLNVEKADEKYLTKENILRLMKMLEEIK